MNDDDNEQDAVEVIVRREDFLKLTKHGTKFLRRQTQTFRIVPTSRIFNLLEKTHLEFFVENGEVKNKPRIPPAEVKVFAAKKSESRENLFKFETPLRKSSRKLDKEEIVNDGAGCSSWMKKETSADETKEDESGEEEDENLERMKLNFNITRRSMTVDIDDLLVFLENYDEQTDQGTEPSKILSRAQQTIDVETNEHRISIEVLVSDLHQVPSTENCPLNFDLKRPNTTQIDREYEMSIKIHRLSQELVSKSVQ